MGGAQKKPNLEWGIFGRINRRGMCSKVSIPEDLIPWRNELDYENQNKDRESKIHLPEDKEFTGKERI